MSKNNLKKNRKIHFDLFFFRNVKRLKQINSSLGLPTILPGKESARTLLRQWLPLPTAVLSVNI